MAYSNVRETLSRIAIEVSRDANFDDIYNRRFRKYCLLLSKEKELLRRMRGSRTRSSTLGNSIGNDEPTMFNAEITTSTDNLAPECRAFQRPMLADGGRTTSLKDMRHLLPPNHSLLTSKRLSTSFEILEPNETTERSSSFSEGVRSNSISSDEGVASNCLPNSRPSKYKPSNISHAKSCDNLMFPIQQRLLHSKSFDNIFYENGITTSSRDLRNYDKKSVLTSSSRKLTEENIRNAAENVRINSPSLQKRLAEAKLKANKRGETMRKLDEDFNKAKQIIQKYKSTDSLDTILQKDVIENTCTTEL